MMSSTLCVNGHTVSQLKNRMSPAMASQLVIMFKAELKSRIQHICKALNDNDRKTLRQEIHSMKGCAASMGGEQLARQLYQLEQYCDQQNTVDTLSKDINLLTLIGEISNLSEQTIEQLTEHMDNLPT